MRQPFGYINVDDSRKRLAESNLEDASCFICLEEGDDGRGRPLLRDCSCRGSAGWAHFDCLVKYAREKSEALIAKGSYMPCQLSDVWVVCCNCKQEFQKDLSVAMASSCVEYIKKHRSYMRKQWDLIEMLKVKQSMHFNAHEKEGKQVSQQILTLLTDQTKSITYSGPRIPEQRLLELEADTNRGLSCFCLQDQDYEGAITCSTKAIRIYDDLSVRFEKDKYMCMIACAKGSIEEARKILRGGGTNQVTESALEESRRMHEREIKEFGEAQAIGTGLNYVAALKQAGYSIKAQRLSTKLFGMTQQIHGSDHPLTKEALRSLTLSRHRGMKFNDQDYAFIRYNESKDKYIVRGPLDMGNFSHISDKIGQKRQVSIGSCRLFDRTPVVIRGLGSAQKHLNGKIGETMGQDTVLVSVGNTLRVISYNVRLKNGDKVRMVPDNLHVLFDV